MPELTRRAFLRAGGAVGLAALIPAEVLSACGATPPPNPFNDHEMSLITEATARLVPGPLDDPAESGHPGAREADVAGYIATLVGALSYVPARVYAGGPFSNRAGSPVDDMAHFLPLSRVSTDAWHARISTIRDSYFAGLSELDHMARQTGAGGFLALDATGKDRILATNFKIEPLPSGFTGFTDMLFSHAIEGTYSAPEYGGNRGLSGWRDIGFPGDVQPRGYTPRQVSSPLNRVELVPTPAVQALLKILDATSPEPVQAP
jgi:hypothetical protein